MRVTVEEKITAQSVLVYRLDEHIVRRSMIPEPFPFAVVRCFPDKEKMISFHINRHNAELCAKRGRRHGTAVVCRIYPREEK